MSDDDSNQAHYAFTRPLSVCNLAAHCPAHALPPHLPRPLRSPRCAQRLLFLWYTRDLSNIPDHLFSLADVPLRSSGKGATDVLRVVRSAYFKLQVLHYSDLCFFISCVFCWCCVVASADISLINQKKMCHIFFVLIFSIRTFSDPISASQTR